MKTLEKDAIILVGIVLILVAGMLFFLGGEEEEIKAVQPEIIKVPEAAAGGFKIDGIEFCNNINEETFECDANENADFKAGQDIFILAQVSGFKQPFKDNKYSYRLSESMDVFGPDGKKIEELSGFTTESAGSEDEFSDFLLFSNRLPANLLGGEGSYQIRFNFKDELSGNEAARAVAFTSGGAGLNLKTIEFCNSIDDNFNCDINEDGIFEAGEDVWIFAEAVNYKQLETEQGFLVGINAFIEVTDESGNTIYPLTGQIAEIKNYFPEKGETLKFKTRLDPSVLDKGNYDIRAEVEDELGLIRTFTNLRLTIK